MDNLIRTGSIPANSRTSPALLARMLPIPAHLHVLKIKNELIQHVHGCQVGRINAQGKHTAPPAAMLGVGSQYLKFVKN